MNGHNLGEKIVNVYKHIEDKFVDTFLEEDGSMKTGGMAPKVTSAYQKIEDAVVGGYQKVEDTVVGGYKKVENAFVDTFLEKSEDHKTAPEPNSPDQDKK